MILERALDPVNRVRLFALAATATIGALAGLAPPLAILLVMGVFGLAVLIAIGQRATRAFLASLTVILIGYAFFNRTFAYLGLPPLYVGEIVLGLGALAFLTSSRRWALTRVHVLLLLFMGWGAAQTIPYLPLYGVDAIRDAVGWIYGLFAVFLSAVVLPEHFPRIVRLVRRVLPYWLVWVPIAGLATQAIGDRLPTVLGGVRLLTFKGGDAGVLLGGAAAFVLLGLYAWADRRPRLPEPLVWIPWLVSAGVVFIVNRGGMIAASTAGAALLFIRQSSRWLSVGFIIALVTILGLLIDPRIDVGARRELSFRQLTENVASIFGESTSSSLEGTQEFRLRWWSYIISYTIEGPYFWTGKGYGIALAADDGFDTTEAEELRSPHNGHIEILARAGVPGLILWLLLHVTFAGSMLSTAWRANRAGHTFWVAIIGWLFVLWAAGMANASFDPYLQGPQGGIWFWSAMGLGMAAMRATNEALARGDKRIDFGTEPPVRVPAATDLPSAGRPPHVVAR